jgi:hypothetical protein
MLCIAAMLLFQPPLTPSQDKPWRTELATVPAHALKTKTVAGLRPVKVYVHNNKVVRGLRPLNWIYEVPSSYDKVLLTLLNEGFTVFPTTHRSFETVKPITDPRKVTSKGAFFSHKGPGVDTWVSITAGKLGLKLVPIKGTDTGWTTISIGQDPKLFGPVPDWPKEGKATTSHWPKPPVKMLAGKTADAYQTWATAAAAGQDYTYVISEPPAKVRTKLEKEFGKPLVTHLGHSFNIGLVNKRRWRVRAGEVMKNPDATLVVVSEYQSWGEGIGKAGKRNR